MHLNYIYKNIEFLCDFVVVKQKKRANYLPFFDFLTTFAGREGKTPRKIEKK